jgi:hypothetical protein
MRCPDKVRQGGFGVPFSQIRISPQGALASVASGRDKEVW